jgi:toluene monooxygenase electron transfer component
MSTLTEATASVATFRIQISDGGPAFACAPGDTLLRAALRGGVGLPYECNSGGCGSCRFQLQDGEIEDLWPAAPGLPARSRDRGFRLACQSRPTSDCTIKVRAQLHPGLTPLPQRRRVELLSRIELTSDMAEFTFRANEPAEFLAGQFALLSLPGVTGDRAYSMSNLPNSDGLWSFVVKRMPNGTGSTTLFDKLAPGSELMLDGPYGLAYLRKDSPRNIICIAGGSGLSPVLAILGAAARSENRQRRLSLYYGGRRPADLCVPAVIERDAAMRGRVDCITAISDPSITEGWNGERGFIHEVVRRQLEADGNPAANDYYFCGPPAMTDAVQRMLLELQVPTSQTFYDRFV